MPLYILVYGNLYLNIPLTTLVQILSSANTSYTLNTGAVTVVWCSLMRLEEMESRTRTRSRDWEIDIMCHCKFSSARPEKVVWISFSDRGEVKVIDRLFEEFQLPSHGSCPVQWMLSVLTRNLKKKKKSPYSQNPSVCLPPLFALQLYRLQIWQHLVSPHPPLSFS